METGCRGWRAGPLLALTPPLHPQGRAGADGARGMPGEPGVKVTGLGPSLMPTQNSRTHLFPGDTAPPHSGLDGKGAGTSPGLPLSSLG